MGQKYEKSMNIFNSKGKIRPSAEELDGARFWTMEEIHYTTSI